MCLKEKILFLRLNFNLIFYYLHQMGYIILLGIVLYYGGNALKIPLKYLISIYLIVVAGLIVLQISSSSENTTKANYRKYQEYNDHYKNCNSTCFKQRNTDPDYYCEHEKLWDLQREHELNELELDALSN